ncbi:hypothetical protein B0H10DRAFT_2209740 [Mycena sp. CBHHK59/15]|nr:hypothetical protein B0H10DRAFT_2209740 [Mycena sp. CBHHK59/15]
MFDRRTILDYRTLAPSNSCTSYIIMDPQSPPPFKRRPIQPPDSPFSAGSPRKRINVADVVLPKGNKLIVHGAYAADDSTHDPVKLIKASINRLKSGPVLATIPVVTIPFSDRFPNQVTAYVGLHPSLNSPDPDDEPRCDLLDVWKKALQDANPTWEVAWAPATEGTDKRMWTRYPTFVPDLARKLDREPTKDETVKCLLDILKANKIAVERAFALGTNGAAAILIHPCQADTILRQRSVNSHGFLPDKLQVDHVRQIEIEQPFELVVAGLSAYEQLDQLIIGYLSEFVDEGGDLLAGWRSPEGHRDLLVFHMATWTAAKHILNDHKNFQETFSKYQLTPPELVFSMNDGAVPWKVTNTVVEEAGKIGTQIDKLTHRFDKVERDVGVRLDATHAIVADVQKSTGYLTDQVANLATTQQHTNLALISMQREVALTRQRAPLEVAESSLRMLVMLGGMEEEKNEARKNIETLKAEKARIDAQIDVLQGSTLALPPPPPRAPAPIPCTPPGLPATPTNLQSVQHGTSSRQPSPLSPTDPVNSSPRTPTQHDTEGEKAHKHRRLSNEADGDITEEKEVSEFAQPEQDTSMDDAPAMTNSKTAKNLPNSDYEILEEEGVKTTNQHLYKWGVVLGIRKDVQIVQRLMNLDVTLKGCVIAADVALQTTNGKAYHHRIFAVYAPWDPGTNKTRDFWPALTKLMQNTRTSWSLGGDLNTTVTAAERASGGADARDKYLAFLDAVNGHNLWTACPERNCYYDWMSSGQDAEKNGGSIIDHFVTSKATLIDSHIYVTNGGKDFVPNTNHRAVIASVIHRPPEGGNTTFSNNPVTLSKPRIKYPSKLESHRHKTFRNLFDESARAEGLYDICVNDEESFDKLYKGIGRVITPRDTMSPRKSTGESLRTSQAINRCYAEAKGDVTLSAFANKLKHEAYKALFAVQAAEVKARAAYRDKSQIMAALCVVNALDSDVLIGDPDGVKDNAQLVNYIVINSTFPGDIKDTTLAMFHKCGLRTDLSNWCGIFLSNFITNCPITWLNSLLTPYISKLRILPDTQVAMQQDVQTRDLMSYLAGIKCWAVRQKVLFFAVKRDQKKGFDYLSPVGLHDAACVYGFPQQIIDIDIASQTDVRCFIRMAHGITEPITISGVNKQGGPMLPLKSTLTTSLGHHYLNDLLANDPDALILTTASFKKADLHLPDDRLKLHVAMTEATDDSYIFAKSLPSLRRNTLEMERFQFAYGWLTQWTKTMAYAIQASGNLPAKITFDSVTDQRGVDPMIVTQHEVPLIRDELDFLRAKVDNPTARYEELKAFINAFSFPKALLLLQPIKQSDTEELNRKIMRKVHDKLGMPFTPNTKILNLPLKFHGLEFPSIARINAGIAIDGLARDLNHHIPAYHTMARIMMADWTCMINNWIDPIDEMGLRTDFSHYPSKIPYGWIVAQKVMGSVKPRLSLRITERAEILRDPGNALTARRQ